jgi:hypothetical protein
MRIGFVSHLFTLPERDHDMTLLKLSLRALTWLGLFILAMLAGCSPKYDWREVRAEHAPYMIAFPGKPVHQSRNLPLAGKEIKMTMSSTQVDGITFAVGSASLPDAIEARAALPLLKATLLANIQGQIKQESSPAVGKGTALQIEALGQQSKLAVGGAQQIELVARFIAQDKQIYQLVVMGKPDRIVKDTIDTFFTSFKVL